GLLPVTLLWNFPRDERGRLSLGETVLLASYDSLPPPAAGRRLWLAVSGPARRRDPQALTLRLVALTGENQTHLWAAARWLWDARAQGTTRAERWGVDDLPLTQLGLTGWQEGLAGWSARGKADQTASEKATASLWLQDAGRPAEALGLYNLELSPE